MKDFSQETISIEEKDYTLFLNRKGIIAWEKFAKEENNKIQQQEEDFEKSANEKNAEITKETNPFEDIDDTLGEKNDSIISQSYRKLYWIMLYENHKLNIDQVNELYDKAIKEYGELQLVQLANQMLSDANKNRIGNEELKKLPALRPSKK